MGFQIFLKSRVVREIEDSGLKAGYSGRGCMYESCEG